MVWSIVDTGLTVFSGATTSLDVVPAQKFVRDQQPLRPRFMGHHHQQWHRVSLCIPWFLQCIEIYELIAPPLPTPTGLLGGPSQSSLNQVIDVSVLNVNITWSEGWVLQTSTCDPSIKSMITSTVNSSFTYIQESNRMLSGLFLEVELTRLL